MINAKDTFYLMLRDRLAALNPTRTMGLRGIIRPGILVEENELATDAIVPDIFRLHWTTLSMGVLGPLPLATMTCEIRYATTGTASNGGMDRGRLLTVMDSELTAALQIVPHQIQKRNYAASSVGVAPVAMLTNVFWSDASFSETVATAERLERTATVEVFCYQEPGE
ncbi:hypothetical protein [Granulicella arctica]|uniref:hypothetical protein n=1 Tax=Granulicella arctica TaxID=940613 RepID=UPI0021DF9820|nr:hypothetical protein [Granulicella arctica]